MFIIFVLSSSNTPENHLKPNIFKTPKLYPDRKNKPIHLKKQDQANPISFE